MRRFPQPFDAAFAGPSRLVAEMNLHGITDCSTIVCAQSPQILHRLWGQNNLVPHLDISIAVIWPMSSHNLANIGRLTISPDSEAHTTTDFVGTFCGRRGGRQRHQDQQNSPLDNLPDLAIAFALPWKKPTAVS